MSAMGNLVVELIDYESGNLDDTDTLDLFAKLVKSGFAWSLQGSYGRTAQALINEGWISETGEVLAYP
ncbi:hypothetical protein SEA_MANEEKUL_66 [Streptomyces phage Maneekul]|uniref:DUF7417 domain-containing protein n=2 Tax=Likavirus TaxID=1982880 RepID=A0A514U4I0_9CAUD|nr:hypothetical protein KGG98_gp66 [Streptomyces phage Yasdnil]YP_010056546.1 hypothetical protein KGG99_gp66 [Streptomyces phage Werner]AWN07434.1 hypothetical protein SEA_MANEEKUL_66 [Streptomyces phage Maneekul]QDK03235.1 hypothetical protein SEA_TUANPN_64 [Streptomyces phage TuanPN]QFP95233.1 hypothetical protein SEA_WHATEVER_66 [Streptomyces phage Whatever]QQO39681.1 hypothetical protein SEA_HIPPO_66 [Streptomyces phage Hippo]QQO39988.1 hypothetical protein SEA_DWAYNE_66 [Streptomyces ph